MAKNKYNTAVKLNIGLLIRFPRSFHTSLAAELWQIWMGEPLSARELPSHAKSIR